MLGDERLVELNVLRGAFVGEADRLGEAGRLRGGEAVTAGIGGRARFAFGRDRPLGFFPVGTGGGNAAGGGHEFWGLLVGGRISRSSVNSVRRRSVAARMRFG